MPNPHDPAIAPTGHPGLETGSGYWTVWIGKSARSLQPIFTRDGTRLIAIGFCGTPERHKVKTWNLESGRVVNELRHDSNLTHHAMSVDEQRIAAGDEHGNVIVWDTQSGKKQWPPVKIHEGRIDGLAFSPDGRLIASGSSDGMLVVIDANSGQEKFRLGRFKGWTRKVMFSPDGRWIAIGPGGVTPC